MLKFHKRPTIMCSDGIVNANHGVGCRFVSIRRLVDVISDGNWRIGQSLFIGNRFYDRSARPDTEGDLDCPSAFMPCN